MATIKDIANRLGVSVSTVSKGLNGASDISDELRQDGSRYRCGDGIQHQAFQESGKPQALHFHRKHELRNN